MNKEIEVKFNIKNKKAIEEQLEIWGWTRHPRYLSLTYGFFSKDSIEKGIFPRVRLEGKNLEITVKVKNSDRTDFFERDEYTVQILGGTMRSKIEQADEMIKIFQALGYDKIRKFEKERTVWTGNTQLQICIDELPFGNYIEIEGEPLEIDEMVGDLKLKGERITKSYLGVYEDHCKKNGFPIKDDVVF